MGPYGHMGLKRRSVKIEIFPSLYSKLWVAKVYTRKYCDMSSTTETKEVKVAETKNEEVKEAVFSLDEDVGSEVIKLTSIDGVSFEVTKKEAIISQLMSTSLESDITATEIPIPSMNGKILKFIVEYMKYHNGVPGEIIEKPLKSKIMKENCKDPWDADYIDRIALVKEELYDLILGANYMNIMCLLHLGCACVATMIRGQPLEKIPEILATGPTLAATGQTAKPATPSMATLTTALAVTSITDTSSSSSSSPPVTTPKSDSVNIHSTTTS